MLFNRKSNGVFVVGRSFEGQDSVLRDTEVFCVLVFYLPSYLVAIGVFGLVGGYRFGAVLRVLNVPGACDFRGTVGASTSTSTSTASTAAAALV